MTIGFVALWNSTPCEYHASEADEWGTTERIQAAFARGTSRGIRTYGLYNCRWSSPWHYLTFWVSPDLTAVIDTIADLERAGDFKFADSEHLVGYLSEARGSMTPGSWDEIPWPIGGEAAAGLFFAWCAGKRATRAPAADPGTLLAPLISSSGLRILGEFDCRFSTGWDGFTFWIAPQVETLEHALAALEREGAFVGADTQAVTGSQERYYRFGNHLQMSSPL